MISVVRAILLLASLGLASSVVLAARHNTEAGHNPPVATFAVDVNTAGNVYTADPNADGNLIDNSLAVEVADFCIQVAAPGPQPIDIVARNLGQVLAYDVRLNFDPALAAVAAVNHVPFADPQGVPVGFLNLPVDPNSLGRTEVFGANNLDTAGTAFFAATHLGRRDAFFAPDHPHAASGEEPYSATDPDGVTLVRFTLSLNAEANGKVVNLDLNNQPVPGNDYVSLDPASDPASAVQETVPVPDSNLIDGAIAVNTACPAPPPGAGPVAPAQTPGPGGGGTPPGSTPGGSPDGADGTGSPSPDSESATPADGNGPGGSDSDDDDDGDGDGPLGTGSDWEIPVLVALALIIPASAGGAYWLWRRRFR